MANKHRKVTLGQLGVFFTGNKKKSVVKVTSSITLSNTDTAKDKKGKCNKGKKKGSESSTEVVHDEVEKPAYIWNEEIAKLSYKENPLKLYKSILHKSKGTLKHSNYTVQKRKLEKKRKPISFAIPAAENVPSKPFIRTDNPGISVDDNGHIVSYSILGTESEYLAQAAANGNVMIEKKEEDPLSDYPHEEVHILSDRGTWGEHCLNTYEQCISEWKIQKKHISDILHRSQEDMLMSESYQQTEPGSSKLLNSGNPNFWDIEKTDPRLVGFWKQPVQFGDELRGIHSTISKRDQGFLPPRELDGFPNCVREEREYVVSKETIPKVYAIPDTSELYVKGINPSIEAGKITKQARQREPPCSPERLLENENFWKRRLYVQLDGTWMGPKTIIENTVFGPHLALEESGDMPLVMLTGDSMKNGPRIRLCQAEVAYCPAKVAGRSVHAECGISGYNNQAICGKARLENCGSTVIHYQWQKIYKPDTFNLRRNYYERFFFDDKDGSLIPGEHKDIPVIFRSPICGMFSEQWKLLTRPNLCGDGEILLTLWGIARERDEHASERKAIEETLRQRMSRRIADDTLKEILFSVHQPEPDRSHDRLIPLTGTDLFYSINPKFHYKSNLVDELLRIADITDTNHGFNRWTISVEQLMKSIKELPNVDDVANNEDGGSPAVLQCGQNYMLRHLNPLISKLSFPTLQPMDVEKYIVCQNLFKHAMDNLAAVAEELKNMYGQKINTVIESKESNHDHVKVSGKKSSKEKKTASSKQEAGSKNNAKGGKTVPPAGNLKKSEPPRIQTVIILKENPVLYNKYMDKLNIACKCLLGEMVTDFDGHLSCFNQKKHH